MLPWRASCGSLDAQSVLSLGAMWPLLRLMLIALMVCPCMPATQSVQHDPIVAKWSRGAGRGRNRVNWRSICAPCSTLPSPSLTSKCQADCKSCVLQKGKGLTNGARCPRGAAITGTWVGWAYGTFEESGAWLNRCIQSCDCTDVPRSRVFDGCAKKGLRPNLLSRTYNVVDNRCEFTQCDCSKLPPGYVAQNDCPAGVPFDPASLTWDPFREVCYYAACSCSLLAPNSPDIINPCGTIPPRLDSLFFDGEVCRYFDCNCSSLLPSGSNLIRNPCGDVPPDPNSLVFDGAQCAYFNCNCSAANSSVLCGSNLTPVAAAPSFFDGVKCVTECSCPSGGNTIFSSSIKDAACDCPGCVDEQGCCTCDTCGGFSFSDNCSSFCNPFNTTTCQTCVYSC